MDNDVNLKEELRAILRYYDKRLDSCTMQETKSVYRMFVENMELDGTIRDFAEYYNTSESNIRSTICRKLLAKPKRVLLYPFHKFMKVVPEKTRKKAKEGRKD